jgi:hypothetical protein
MTVSLSHGTVRAAESPKTSEVKPKATFNHLRPTARIKTVEVQPGETFIVRIEQTCPGAFEYSFEPLAGDLPGTRGLTGPRALEPQDIKITHEERFGGYLIAVQAKAQPVACEGGEGLKPESFVVSVDQPDWNVAFEGGFTFSSLTSPVFALVPSADGQSKQVVSEPDKEDDVHLGAASFVSVFNERYRIGPVTPALSFGLGINKDNRAEYLLGLGLKFGDKASVIGGFAWGAISRLPNGVTTSSPVTNDNVLNNLGSQTVRRWFFGLSYSFLSSEAKGKLAKPFAEAAPAVPKPADGARALACAQIDASSSLSISIAAEAGESPFCFVRDEDFKWEVGGLAADSWLSVAPASGSAAKGTPVTLTIKAAANPAKEPRKASLTLAKDVPLTVSQQGSAAK